MKIDETRQKCGKDICTGIKKIEFRTGFYHLKRVDCANDEKADENQKFYEEPILGDRMSEYKQLTDMY